MASKAWNLNKAAFEVRELKNQGFELWYAFSALIFLTICVRWLDKNRLRDHFFVYCDWLPREQINI